MKSLSLREYAVQKQYDNPSFYKEKMYGFDMRKVKSHLRKLETKPRKLHYISELIYYANDFLYNYFGFKKEVKSVKEKLYSLIEFKL